MHFRGSNFKNFLGGMPPHPPRSSGSSRLLLHGLLRVTFSKLRLLQNLMTALQGLGRGKNFQNFQSIFEKISIINLGKSGYCFIPFLFLTLKRTLSSLLGSLQMSITHPATRSLFVGNTFGQILYCNVSIVWYCIVQ